MAERKPSVGVHERNERLKVAVPWISLVARLILGGSLLWAGLLKIGNLEKSVFAVEAYELPLPGWMTTVIGYGLPIVNLLLGAIIIAGVFTRWTSLLGVLIMVVFIAGIASAWIRGLNIDCGCFSGGGVLPDDVANKYLIDILRDIGFIACGVFVMIFPKSPISVDKWIAGNELEEA